MSTVKHHTKGPFHRMLDTIVRDVPHLPIPTMQLLLRYLLCIGLTNELVHIPCIFLVQVFVVKEPFPQTLDPLLSHCKVVRQIRPPCSWRAISNNTSHPEVVLSASWFPETQGFLWTFPSPPHLNLWSYWLVSISSSSHLEILFTVAELFELSCFKFRFIPSHFDQTRYFDRNTTNII